MDLEPGSSTPVMPAALHRTPQRPKAVSKLTWLVIVVVFINR
jgi:hypothetical protein